MLRSSCPAATAAALLTLVAACSAGGNGGATADSMPETQPAAGGVATVLTLGTAQVAPGDSIPLSLHVVNGTTEALTLEFTSSQRYNLWIAPADGEPIWTWAADKLFMQALGQETIAPGDTIQFRDTIPAPADPGEYRVIGSIATTTRDLSDTASVTVGP
jgi:hypothetical protein